VQIILRELGAKDPAARSARPEQFIDASIVKELDSSGFIDRLYKSTAVAKAAPKPEPVASAPAQKSPKSDPAPAVAKASPSDTKTKPLASEEKVQPAAKQVQVASAKASASPAPGAKSERSSAQQYVVKPGDTLARLADQFYSAPHKWEKIYEANKDQVKNPNYIYVGMKLNIPADG
jgi:nucleoid-associated protein YgaU